MSTVKLFDLSRKSMLGTRAAARSMQAAIREATHDGTITLDTSGIRRISVSFFDESLLIFSDLVAETNNHSLRMIYSKAPRPESLSSLVEKRGLNMSESAAGDWIISGGDKRGC